MFRKFTDKLSAAANAAASAATGATSAATGANHTNHHSDEQQKVKQLTAMGFDRTQATQALQATQGNVDQAMELLLAQQQHEQHPSPPEPRTTTARRPVNNNHNETQEEQDLRRAMQASLEDAKATTTTATQKQQPRTAAMNKAAQAAEARTNGLKLSTAGAALMENHPAVKLVPKLQDKTVEEQIVRCADRLKNSPQAVDTLYKACYMIQQHPTETKYRTIDTTTPGFQRSLAPATGALDFLKALQFQSNGNNKLVLYSPDPARIYLGVSALEQTKLTPEYIAAKQRIVFTAEMTKLRALADSSTEEAIARAGFMQKCPSEPTEGRGAWIQVALSDTETVQRRFDSDDTLQDVLHWLAGHATVILQKLETREWMLVDVHRYPSQPLDCVKHTRDTLQYLGCWPSGKLELQPSTDDWKSSTSLDTKHVMIGSARGLGAAPKEAM